MARCPTLLCLLTLTAAVPDGVAAAADDATAASAPRATARAEALQLLADLDSGQYEARRRAAARFEELLSKPELTPVLAREFQRALLRPETSFEVRWHLERWLPRLPKAAPEPPQTATSEELKRLIDQLDDDSYGVRVGAARRLEWLLANSRLAGPVLIGLKKRLADPSLPPEAARRLEDTWQTVRGAWLLSEPQPGELPAVSAQQINRWADQLVEPLPAGKEPLPSAACRAAERELQDLLTRDDCVPRVTRALESRLAEPRDPQAAARLQKLLELTRPAMVAEYWAGRRNLSEQHLLVGVPSQAAGAVRPSHFDYIDDNRAHCASGNTLRPGDYPVNVAFPHPITEGAFFHLVNLPTPRRRMAYTYHAKTDDAARLAALSRRTLDRFLAERRPLSEPELVMLAQLDPAEVSRFAGKYFLMIDDLPLDAAGQERLGGRPSRHGMVCAQLAIDGTKAAVPGLLQAIDKGRFLPPTSLAPHRLHYLAALSIARRDPWPEADAWLADQLARAEPLAENQRADGPQVGATAAALLLRQRRQSLASFGLESAADPLLLQLGLDGYRFASPEGRTRVQQWWQQVGEKRKDL